MKKYLDNVLCSNMDILIKKAYFSVKDSVLLCLAEQIPDKMLFNSASQSPCITKVILEKSCFRQVHYDLRPIGCFVTVLMYLLRIVL